MGGNSFGTLFKVTTFGESHGPALGVVVDGCPAGIVLEQSKIQKALDRRRPGFHGGLLNAAVTARKESDECEILSGVFEGRTTGSPIAILIKNTSQHSKDYENLRNVFRPGHADFTYTMKYGNRDFRGGGRSSGRETAARVAAGEVARAVLAWFFGESVCVRAFTLRAAGIQCDSMDFSVVEKNPMRAADLAAAEKMNQKVEEMRIKGDSCGGIIECHVTGIPVGLGEPVFEKLDAELAKAIISIGAVKGIEFGAGFACADMTGSVVNDAMYVDGDKCCFNSNNSGGILGGISNGNEIVFRAAVKPVPSIFLKQNTVKFDGKNFEDVELEIEGRHDVCLCPRIVPVIEAMTCVTLADMCLRQLAQEGAGFRL